MGRQNREEIEDLFEQCRTGDADAQIAAMRELERLRASGAVSVLVPLIESPECVVRMVAAHALGTLGAEDIHESGRSLIRLLADPEEIVRRDAATALGMLRYTSARLAIEHVLLHDPDWVTRASAAEALGELGDVQAVDALERALSDEHEPVRAYAALAIGLVGSKAHRVIIHRHLAIETAAGARGELLVAALRLGDTAAFDELVALMGTVHEEADAVGLHNALDDMLSRRTPPIVIGRAEELDQALIAFDGPSLRERLAELIADAAESQ